MKKQLTIVGISIGVFSIGFGLAFLIDSTSSKKVLAENLANTIQAETTASAPENTKKESPEFTLSFVGPIMLDRTVKTSVDKVFDGDYGKLFESVAPLIAQADMTFATIKGPISSMGKPLFSKDPIRMEPKVITALHNAGLDVLSVATEHSNDWSLSAFLNTLDQITLGEMKYSGGGRNYKEARKPTLLAKDGLIVGYLSFSDRGSDIVYATETTPGILSANDPQIEEIIANAKAEADILVVSFYWGTSGTTHTKRQEYLAHTVIDAGATIVVGSGPNEIQDLEYYHGGLIAYSLGNFIDENSTTKGSGGLYLETRIKGGIITNIQTYRTEPNKDHFISSLLHISPESLITEKSIRYSAPKEIERTKLSLNPAISKSIVYRGNSTTKIAITIDDGWNAAYVQQGINTLLQKNATATIFPVGSIVKAIAPSLQTAVSRGIELGNHTETHGWITSMSDSRVQGEIDGWQEHVDAALGYHYDSHWFRPPFMAGFGDIRTKNAERITSLVVQNDMKVALWSLDPFYGVSTRATAGAVSNFIISNAQGGDIILMHFTREHMTALPMIINGLRAKGFEFVTLSELMNE